MKLTSNLKKNPFLDSHLLEGNIYSMFLISCSHYKASRKMTVFKNSQEIFSRKVSIFWHHLSLLGQQPFIHSISCLYLFLSCSCLKSVMPHSYIYFNGTRHISFLEIF